MTFKGLHILSIVVLTTGGIPEEVRPLCQKWLSESPKAARLSIVFGPYGKGTFVALCRKTLKSLGWNRAGEGVGHGRGLPGDGVAL